jgi:hypothetical protein
MTSVVLSTSTVASSILGENDQRLGLLSRATVYDPGILVGSLPLAYALVW